MGCGGSKAASTVDAAPPTHVAPSAPAGDLSEEDWLKRVLAENQKDFGTNEPNSEKAAVASHNRGVTIEFLLDFTNKNDCWDWPTWKVVLEVVKPATAATRCRYADLPEVKATGAVGPADSFGSHCWGAKWGLLVAAIADKASPSRRVWCALGASNSKPPQHQARLAHQLMNLPQHQ